MKFPKLLLTYSFFYLFAVTSLCAQQIRTDNSLPLGSLVESKLGATCVEITNISSDINGRVNGLTSFGSFNRGNSDFPFEDGLVLTTGQLASAGNTLISATLNDGDENWGTDPDLERALGISQTLNATSIEFDFVTVSNLIEFNYILASEEYSENFPCQYSDGFAFLIRPAGSSEPYRNIALIPGTSTPVNTRTIHDEIVGFCPSENNQFFEGNNLGDTNYNGRTTVLTASAAITPNVKYHIKLVIADQDDQNYDSAVFIEGNSFNATIDLGPDIETCAESVTLNADIGSSNAQYEWYRNGNVIAGATNPTYEASITGNYSVLIKIPFSDSICEISDEVVIDLQISAEPEPISDLIACDDLSGDGIESFDLASKGDEVIQTVSPGDYAVSYHPSFSDAQNRSNPLSSPYSNTSNPQTVYARIVDNVEGCVFYAVFDLVVNPPPSVVDPSPLTICDDAGSDGITEINLDGKSAEITRGNSDLFVSYHFSELDANSGENPTFTPYTNTNPSETLFVRVFNAETGCYNTTTLDLTVIPNPPVSTDRQWINACEEDTDGIANFDLSENISDVLQGLSEDDFDISHHTSREDALTGANPITNVSNFQNTEAGLQITWIRIVDKNTGCASIVPQELHANIVETGFITSAFEVCDDASQDGRAPFDLNLIEENLLNDYDGFNVFFYETPEDQANETNPLDKTVPYIVTDFGTTIYVTVKGGDCTEEIPIVLRINPAIELGPLGPVDYCDDDTDGFVSILLETFDETLGAGIDTSIVEYYLTEEDARSGENLLPPFYTNTSNPQTLYARVTNAQTGCSDVGPFEVNIITAPSVAEPSDLTVCELDDDGTEIVDLTVKNSEIISNPSSFAFSYFLTEIEAVDNQNPIENPEMFEATSQVVFVRVDNESSGCFNTIPLNIFINSEHDFPAISTFQNCDSDGSGVSDFFFNVKDAEILNGQENREVFYFRSESDAENRVNPIDKFSAFRNTSNPQTIYARVEGTNNPDCFAFAPFQLEVGTLPPFNDVDDTFVCDDMSNDGIETIDLSLVIDQLT